MCLKGPLVVAKKCCEDKGLEADGERVNFYCPKLSHLLLDTNFILL